LYVLSTVVERGVHSTFLRLTSSPPGTERCRFAHFRISNTAKVTRNVRHGRKLKSTEVYPKSANQNAANREWVDIVPKTPAGAHWVQYQLQFLLYLGTISTVVDIVPNLVS
jgi:hypothetical protein